MAGDCTFCRIVEGEEECFDVYEDGEVLAFLDINPISKGQCLVIPKRHVTWFYDMRDDELGSLFEASKEVANRSREAFDVEHVSLFLRGPESLMYTSSSFQRSRGRRTFSTKRWTCTTTSRRSSRRYF